MHDIKYISNGSRLEASPIKYTIIYPRLYGLRPGGPVNKFSICDIKMSIYLSGYQSIIKYINISINQYIN